MKLKYLYVLLILFLGLFVRIWKIEESPYTVGFDEAALGYNAYSLMLTGKDEHGIRYPLSLKSFGDYKPAMYAYLTIPFIKVFGVCNLSLRMVSAISGVVLALMVYLILGIFVKNEKLRLFGLVLALMQPWSLHFSRVALETNLSATFYTVGIYFYLVNRRKFKWGYFISYIFAFIFSIYSYHGARVAVPLFLILMQLDPLNWFIEKKVKINYVEILSIALILLFYIPIFLNANASSVLQRFNQENFFKTYTPYAPKELLNFTFSKLYYLIGMLSGRLWAYFSPINWGGRIFVWIRQSVMYIPEFGMLGWIESLTFIVGVILFIKNVFKEKYRMIVYWMVAGLAPAAATWNWFHTLRSLNAIGAVEIISIIGLIYVLSKSKGLIKIGIIFLLLLQFVFVINNEISYSYYETHGNFQPGGFKESIPILSKIIDKYDQVIVDSPQAQSYIFILYYYKIDPRIVQKEAYKRIKSDEFGSWNVDFGKFKFRKIDWDKDKNLKKTILWTSNRISSDQIYEVNGKVYYTDSPLREYKSSQIIALD